MKEKIYLCKHCGKEYKKFNSTQKTCSEKCLKKLNESKDKEKRKVQKLKKSVSVSVLGIKADKLWSEVIRSVGACEYCGKNDFLNAHHIFGRNNKSVRWEKSNGICLCSGCHTFSSVFSAHKNPYLFSKWLEEYKGMDYMENLTKLSQIPMKVTPEYLQEQIDFFKKLLSE